jgi:hypothetical protein
MPVYPGARTLTYFAPQTALRFWTTMGEHSQYPKIKNCKSSHEGREFCYFEPVGIAASWINGFDLSACRI